MARRQWQVRHGLPSRTNADCVVDETCFIDFSTFSNCSFSNVQAATWCTDTRHDLKNEGDTCSNILDQVVKAPVHAGRDWTRSWLCWRTC